MDELKLKAQGLDDIDIKMVQKALLVLTVIFHFAVLLGNIAAVYCVIFFTPWYVALPILTALANVVFAGRCPVTIFEDWLRAKLGIAKITDFMQYYVFVPLVRFFRKKD